MGRPIARDVAVGDCVLYDIHSRAWPISTLSVGTRTGLDTRPGEEMRLPSQLGEREKTENKKKEETHS